jgi:hypothetical protein
MSFIGEMRHYLELHEKGESTKNRFGSCDACFKGNHIVHQYTRTCGHTIEICCQCEQKKAHIKQNIALTLKKLNGLLLDPSRIVAEYWDEDIRDGVIVNKNRSNEDTCCLGAI